MSHFKCQVVFIFIAFLFLRCTSYHNDDLVAFNDTLKNKSGYLNKNGDTVIFGGKYLFCFTDTFKNFAIVSKKGVGLVAINRKEEVMKSNRHCCWDSKK